MSGVCPRTARKWLARYKAEGAAGLRDRSSRPKKLRKPVAAKTVKRIIALRRQRWTGKHIARETGVSPATVSRVLNRAGLSRLKDLEPAEPARRYERAKPGEMIHLDIKKLGRFERTGHRITGDRTRQSNSRARKEGGYGWEYVHVCVDDHSRLFFSQIYPDEKAVSAVTHLKACVAWYKKLGVKVERVMTMARATNPTPSPRPAVISGSNTSEQNRTRPKPTEKAERFIQTALREWAYVRRYETSDQRAADLPLWTHLYNWHRPHGGIKDKTPISRLGLTRDNLLRRHK